MKFRITTSILLLLCLNLCFGQTDTNKNNVEKKNQESKSDTKVKKDNKDDTIKESQKIIQKNNKTTANINNSITTSPGLTEFNNHILIDKVRNLRDSINALNKTILKLEETNNQLKNDKEDLKKQIEAFKSKGKSNGDKRNRVQIIVDTIYNITKGVLLILVFVIFFFWLKRKNKSRNSTQHTKQNLLMPKKKTNILIPQPPIINKGTPKTSIQSQKQTTLTYIQPIQHPKKITPPVESNKQKPFSNINYRQPKSGVGKDNWFVVGGSVIGKSHISSNMPCQDNHFCSSIREGWGIAVSCDGAGSAEHSDKGSEFVAEIAFKIFKDFLQLNKFTDDNILPSEEQWKDISKQAFVSIYNSLIDFSKSERIEFNTLACTTTVVVFTPIGLLSTHIGDGRAGYCNANGEWKALITPHKGEEANQTIFTTSSVWISENGFKMSEVLVPESRVIKEKVIAFTLMSDGFESHSYDCSKMDNETSKWIDPNLPSDKFFNPLLKQLTSMYENNVSIDNVTSSWYKFIEGGTASIREEPDDKTLILGILI